MTRFILVLVLVWVIASSSSHAQLILRVDASEARHLANTYRLCVLGVGCGAVGPAVLHGVSWEMDLKVGSAGAHEGFVRVDAASGVTTYFYGSKAFPLATPSELARQEFEFRHRRDLTKRSS
jgi:hypothetical protein